MLSGLNLKAQNSCLSFTAATQNAQITSTTALSFTGAFTLEAWIYPTAWGANSWTGNIINKEDDATNNGYALRCGSTGILDFAFNNGSATWTDLSSPSGALTLNTWQHVAGVVTGTNVYLYINGIQVATMASTMVPSANTRNIYIGQWAYLDNTRPFTGNIDEVRIWNTAVSASTITSWYNIPVTASHPNYANLLGYYNMNITSPATTLTATVGTSGTVTGASYSTSNNSLFLDNSPYVTSTSYSLGFGYIAFGGSSASQSISLTGANLTSNGTITLTAPTGYSLCLTSGGTYTGTLPIAYTGTTFPATTVYVKFTPTTVNTNYNGNVVVSGGGITSYNIAVTGTSISLVTESFEGSTFLPTGWTFANTYGTTTNFLHPGSGVNPTETPYDGSYQLEYNSYSIVSGYGDVITPVIDLRGRGSSTTTVSFWWYRDCDAYNTSTYNAEGVNVYVNTSAALGGTQLGFVPRNGIASATGTYLASGLVTATSSGWNQYVFNIPASFNTSTNYIIFDFYALDGDNCYMDKVQWTPYPCTPPTSYSVLGGGCNSSDITLSGSQNGVSYQLYNGATAVGSPVVGTGSAIDFLTQTTAGIYTVQTTTAGGYCSATMSGNAMIFTAVPAQPSTITGAVNPASGTSQTYSLSNVTGTNYAWTFPAGWIQTGGGTTNSVTVTVGSASGTISVTPTNTCGSGTSQTLSVCTAKITGTTAASRCGNGTVTLSATATTSAIINWYAALTGGTSLGTGTSFTPTISATTTYYVDATDSATLLVSTPRTAVIATVNNVPAIPSTITGSATPSSGTSQTYSVTNVTGVTYNWIFPLDWVQTSGTTTNSVAATVGTQSGTVTVTPSNTCGNGTAQTKTVTTSLILSVTASGTWICPPGVTSATVQCWGAGGGGGSRSSGSGAYGGGGGGAFATSTLTSLVPGTSYTYTVGSGGGPATAGGNSSFTTLVVAAGGSGVAANSATGATGGTVANCTGTTKYAGGNGGNGTSTTSSGGGGGGAGTTGAGGNATGATAGTGTSLSGGNGGAGRTSTGNGASGSTYGGGGSGGLRTSGSATGGTGAGGYVVITTIQNSNPIIIATTLTSFGSVCMNGTAGPNTFTINGLNLTTANITVGALSGFTYSTTSGGTYTSTLSLTQTGGTYSQIIYVMFNPTAVQSYNGSIPISGGGATAINVTAAGSGVNTVPTVTTPTSAAITPFTATLGGNITALGCSNVTERGIYYSSTTGFANGTGTKVPETGGPFTTGVFTEAVTGLSPATTYYYKAYAVNSGGAAYSTQGTFVTGCIPVNVPYIQDFESVTVPALPMCTALQNAGTGNNWITASPAAYGFSTKVLEYAYNATNTANAWFYTAALNLTAGISYRLSFNYGNSSTSYTEKLKVWYGTNAINTSMTNAVVDYPTINQAAVQTSATDFTPTTTGTYYFGFNCYSALNQLNLFVDNISVNYSPPTGGSISGASTLCAGTAGIKYIYSGGTPIASGWTWTVPSGASFTYGITNDTIYVNWGTTSGNVSCTPTYYGNSGAAVSKAVTINPLPTVAFTTQPGANACINTNVTYTTQSGMSNYVWRFSGILGTDYTIISGDTTTSNSVTLEYLTNISDTVTVNYTNTYGCTAVSPTFSTASNVLSPTAFDFSGGSITPASNPACVNTTLSYSASSSSIFWETAMNGTANTKPTTSTYPVSTSGTYYIRKFDGTCWSTNTLASDPITINPLPIVAPITGGALFVCLNGTTPEFIDSTSGGTWSIIPGTGTASISLDGFATGLTIGKDTVVYTYFDGNCSNTAKTLLTVNPPPSGGTATATLASLCAGTGTTINLTGTSGSIQWQQSTDSITWVNVSGGSGANSTTYTTPLLTSTTYYMAVSTSAGCPTVYSTITHVTVNPLPSPVVVDSSGTYCESTALSATGGTGGTIYWESTLATGTYTQQPSSFQIITSSGTYYFRARTALGCWGASSGAIVVINTPPVGGTATATGTNLCYGSGDTIKLTGNTGNSIQWQQSPDGVSGWTNVTGGSGATTITYNTPNPITATTYYMAISSSLGCPSSSSTVAAVTFANNITTTTPATRCGVGAVSLNATASSGTLKWYAGAIGGLSLATGSPYTPTVSSTTTYYVDAEVGNSAPGSVTIGTGTNLNSSSNGFPTLYADYWYQDWQQLVYTASELTAAGLGAGNITAIKFNVSAVAGAAPTGFSIRLGVTSNSILSAWQTTGLTTVYGPVTPTMSTGWNTFTLTTPYLWDGVSNILVDIRMTEQDGTANATCYNTTTANNTVLWASSGSTSDPNFWIDNPTPTATTSRLNAIFAGTVGSSCNSPRIPVVATVTPPAALTLTGNQNHCLNTITSMSVTSNIPDFNTYIWAPTTNLYMDSLATTAYNGTSTTTVYVKSTVVDTITYTCTATNTTTLCANVATSTVTVMPIPTSVTATASSSTICQGSSVNLTSSGVSHSPNIGAIAYTEGFEETSFPPTSWTLINAGTGNQWASYTAYYHGGSKAMAYTYNASYAANAWAISQAMTLSVGTTYTISFWYEAPYGTSYVEKLKFTVGTAATVAGQTTTLYTNASISNTTWSQATFTYTPTTSGTYYFGLNCYSALNQDVLVVDDISITGSSLAPPTYAWTSNPTGFTSAVQNPTGVVPNVNSQYTVTASNIYGCSASANTATVTLNTPSVGGIATAAVPNICTGTGTTVTVTGYTGTIQWQKSANGTSGWANVTGGSGAATATYTTPTLTATTYYRAVVTSGVCTSANSTTAMVTVNSLSAGGTATATSPTICYKGNTTITLAAYNGTIQWQHSTDSIIWSNVTGGSGATTATYTTDSLITKTYFMAVVTSGACSSANSTAVLVAFPTPTAQPTDMLLASGSISINGSFTPSLSADHYLIIRSTLNALTATPINGTTYDIYDQFGGGTVSGYQTGTSISDAGLLSNTPYYYFVFAANNLTCTNGPVYLAVSPLTGTATTTAPIVLNKTLMITAMFQEYFNSSTGLMNQTLGINWDTGDLFKNFSGTTVDTVTVLIRKTNISADLLSSFPIDTVFYGVNLNNNGLITISLSAGITGYHYIEIKHRNSIETWSDSVNFSSDTVKYDFYNYVSQFAYDNGMLQDGAHAWIWGGDVNQNGNLESEDATIIYVAANSDDPTVNNGYVICDIDGNGNLDSQDYGLSYNNANLGANVINPFSYLKKK